MIIENRLKELNIKLPLLPEPAAIYVPAVMSDEFIFVSGQTPKDGVKLVYKGKLGKDLTTTEGYEAAKLCILRSISAIKDIILDLDRIEKIVKLTGFVNSCDDFTEQSTVINGASELLEKIFGEIGKHARSSIGVNALPGNAAVEIELIVKIKGTIDN
jgi:enamine deaminase RidA (YjgF/YER057c/UK114 family)